MDGALERWILYALCLAGVVISAVALSQGLVQSDTRVIGVSLALIGLLVAVGAGAWWSARTPVEPRTRDGAVESERNSSGIPSPVPTFRDEHDGG